MEIRRHKEIVQHKTQDRKSPVDALPTQNIKITHHAKGTHINGDKGKYPTRFNSQNKNQ